MLPVVPGIIPFGMIMGTVAVSSGLTTLQTMLMNSLIFAGASQLAAIDLMTKNTPVFVIVFAGVVINLRFLLYSAANAEIFQKQGFLPKLFGAYLLTDQSYAVMSATTFKDSSISQKLEFYFGAGILMMVFWNLSVLLGCIFGNIIPPSLSLDFAVPLSFLALTLPSLKSKSHYFVAFFSASLSILFYNLPLKLGLMVTAIMSISIAAMILRYKMSISRE